MSIKYTLCILILCLPLSNIVATPEPTKLIHEKPYTEKTFERFKNQQQMMLDIYDGKSNPMFDPENDSVDPTPRPQNLAKGAVKKCIKKIPPATYRPFVFDLLLEVPFKCFENYAYMKIVHSDIKLRNKEKKQVEFRTKSNPSGPLQDTGIHGTMLKIEGDIKQKFFITSSIAARVPTAFQKVALTKNDLGKKQKKRKVIKWKKNFVAIEYQQPKKFIGLDVYPAIFTYVEGKLEPVRALVTTIRNPENIRSLLAKTFGELPSETSIPKKNKDFLLIKTASDIEKIEIYSALKWSKFSKKISFRSKK